MKRKRKISFEYLLWQIFRDQPSVKLNIKRSFVLNIMYGGTINQNHILHEINMQIINVVKG
jgi:hypothetical protein